MESALNLGRQLHTHEINTPLGYRLLETECAGGVSAVKVTKGIFQPIKAITPRYRWYVAS